MSRGCRVRRRLVSPPLEGPKGYALTEHVVPGVILPVHKQKGFLADALEQRVCSLQGDENLDEGLLFEFHEYCLRWVDDLIGRCGVPVLPDPADDDAWEDRISRSGYSSGRVSQLRAAREKIKSCGLHPYDTAVEGFVKLEWYLEFKPPRAICSRSDGYKAWTYATWMAMNDWVMHNDPHFIKFVPISERPKAISRVESFPLRFVTDFSRFEANFRPELLRIEHEVYARLGFPANLLSPLLDNRVKGFGCSARISGKRMSGELNTSLGNGMMNLLVLGFLMHQEDDAVLWDGFVEGDDAVCGCTALPDVGLASRLGFNLKLQPVSDVGSAGFCSMFFSTSTHHILLHPKRLVTLPWALVPQELGSRKREEYLRGKIMSTLVEAPHSPLSVWYCTRLMSSLGEGRARLRNEYWTRTKLTALGIDYEVNGGWLIFDGRLPSTYVLLQDRLRYQEVFGVPVGIQTEVEASDLDEGLALLGSYLRIDYPAWALAWAMYVRRA